MKKYLFILIYIILLKYFLHILLPFILSVLIYYVIKPAVLYLETKLSIHHNYIIYIIMFLIISVILYYFYTLSLIYIPIFYKHYLQPILILLEHYEISIKLFIPYIKKLPHLITSVFIFLISFILFVFEYNKIKQLLETLLPQEYIKKIIWIKNITMTLIHQYLKCQIILLLINMVVLLLGFHLLKINNPIPISLLACICDIIPFLGLGIVLIPLIIIELILNQYINAFYLFIIYLFLVLIREILEPLIMNKTHHISLFLLLLSTIIHLYIFNIIGLFLSYFHIYLFYAIINKKEV